MQTKRDSYALGHPSLAEDDVNANKFETNKAVDYVINGRCYTKAATANLGFSAGTALAAKQTCAFFVMLDSAGNVTTTQSAIVPSSAGTSYRAGAWDWPDEANKACIGAIVIRTDNAATFTPGTTDLGAADVVDTYVIPGPDYSLPIAY